MKRNPLLRTLPLLSALLLALPATAQEAPAAPARALPRGTEETLLAQLTRAAELDGKRDYLAALETLDRARAELIRKIHFQVQAAPLALRAARLCRQVTRGGEPVPFLKPPEPGDDLCLQVEVGGFNVASRPRGGYVYHVTLAGALLDAKGKEILSFGPVRQFNGVEEFLTHTSLVKYVTIPKDLPHGDYRVAFTAEDCLAERKSLTGEVAFKVGRTIALPGEPVKVLPGASGAPAELDGAGEVEVETGM